MPINPERMWREAVSARKALDTLEAELFKQAFPVNGPIWWEREQYGPLYGGHVVAHSVMGDRIKVRNVKSGAVYWIGSYWVVSNHEPKV